MGFGVGEMNAKQLIHQIFRQAPERVKWYSYSPLNNSEEQEGENAKHDTQTQQTRKDVQRFESLLASLTKSIHLRVAALTAFLIILIGSLLLTQTPRVDIEHQSICPRPAVRREWRSLTSIEKNELVQAILCLSRKPSRWATNGTIYDDFALLHGSIGSWSHQSISFLPWHRYTLHLWETAMKDHCGFQGAIPYWDWSLDWMNLSASSIWDSETGLGGDGNPEYPVTVGEGRCVTDGPFSNLQPIKYNHTYIQHCLSRGFKNNITGEEGMLPGEPYNPEAIGKILRLPTYAEFVKAVERDLHAPLHLSIRGDFLAMTGANDPIFFLHHAQLDHLWWRWQQENKAVRLKEYSGKHMFNSTGEASLNDPLMFAAYAKDLPVSDVIDTQSGALCYKY